MMKLITATVVLEKLVEDFTRRFPKLQTKSGAFGKCKFMSYELALYLRRRGVSAKLLHCQGLPAKHRWLNTAHQTWVGKARAKWSHYVVAVDGQVIDLTARQFDPQLPYPNLYQRSALSSDWETIEYDKFMNTMVGDVLKSQMDANRQMREGRFKKLNTNPIADPAARAQQQLKPAVATTKE